MDRMNRINVVKGMNMMIWMNRMNTMKGIDRVTTVNRMKGVNGMKGLSRMNRMNRIDLDTMVIVVIVFFGPQGSVTAIIARTAHSRSHLQLSQSLPLVTRAT